ncbi:MAG: hypothetical protein IIZ40_01075 [Bacilli bacterium]|nr:hypothetical protein [Bacilli bacterium]
MENKRKNGLVVFLIVIILLLVTLITLLGMGVIKSPFIKECKVKTKTVAVEKEESNKVQLIKIDNEKLSKTEKNNLGEVTVGNKKYKVTKEFVDEANGVEIWNTYLNDVKLDIKDSSFIAVFDNNYVVVKYSQKDNNNYSLLILDKNLDNVYKDYHNYANTFEIVDKNGIILEDVDTKALNKYTDNIIDDNHMFVSECVNNGKTQDYVLKLLTFENDKFNEEEVLHVENIFCSAQR